MVFSEQILYLTGGHLKTLSCNLCTGIAARFGRVFILRIGQFQHNTPNNKTADKFAQVYVKKIAVRARAKRTTTYLDRARQAGYLREQRIAMAHSL